MYIYLLSIPKPHHFYDVTKLYKVCTFLSYDVDGQTDRQTDGAKRSTHADPALRPWKQRADLETGGVVYVLRCYTSYTYTVTSLSATPRFHPTAPLFRAQHCY